MKKLISLLAIALFFVSTSFAQNNFDIRLVSQSLNCEANEVCYDVQIKSGNERIWRFAGQNYRLFYNGAVAEFTRVERRLLSEAYTDPQVVQDAQHLDLSAEGNLPFDENISWLNYFIDLNTALPGDAISSSEWTTTSTICFSYNDALESDENLCFEMVWAREELTTNYATAFVEVSEWVGPSLTNDNVIGEIYHDLNATNGEDACFMMACGSELTYDAKVLLNSHDSNNNISCFSINIKSSDSRTWNLGDRELVVLFDGNQATYHSISSSIVGSEVAVLGSSIANQNFSGGSGDISFEGNVSATMFSIDQGTDNVIIGEEYLEVAQICLDRSSALETDDCFEVVIGRDGLTDEYFDPIMTLNTEQGAIANGIEYEDYNNCSTAPCVDLNPPVSNGDATVCLGDAYPVLSVQDMSEFSVRWYDSQEGTSPIAEGNFYQPSGPGIFYVESFDPINNCFSSDRTTISLLERLLPTYSLISNTCNDQNTYSIAFSTDANSVSNNAGILDKQLGLEWTVSNIPTSIDVQLTLVNNITGCENIINLSASEDCVEPCTIVAGDYEASNDICFNGELAELSVIIGTAPIVPSTYAEAYYITQGDGLQIIGVNDMPQYMVKSKGKYAIHSFIYDPNELLITNIPSEINSINLLEQYLEDNLTNDCYFLDATGVKFNVEDCPDNCLAFSGKPTAVSSACLGNDPVELTVDLPQSEVIIPEGYEHVFVLTKGSDLLIAGAQSNAFMVNSPGEYRVHSLVYNPITFEVGTIDPGVTTANTLFATFKEGGGDICGSFDINGALFNIDQCVADGVDLELQKEISNTNPAFGEEITFTISVSNSSNRMATGVEVVDRLPSGYMLSGSISDGGTSSVDGNGSKLTWSGITIEPMNTKLLSFTAIVKESKSDYKNIAEITASDQNDPDSTPNNDDGDQSEDDEDNVTPSLNGAITQCSSLKYYINTLWRNPHLDIPTSLYISTAFEEANVRIYSSDGLDGSTPEFEDSFEVSKDAPLDYALTTVSEVIRRVSTTNYNKVEEAAGLIVESDVPLTVVYRLTQIFNQSLFVLKGEQGLGYSFVAGTQTDLSLPVTEFEAHFISVMAVEDNTKVTFQKDGYMIEGPAGDETSTNDIDITDGHSVTLNSGETYLIRNNVSSSSSMSGIYVTSDKPVAVSSGSSHSRHGSGSNDRDSGMDQLIPINKLGKEYIAIRGTNIKDIDYLILTGVTDNTNLTINGESIGTIDAGEVQEYKLDGTGGEIYYVSSDKMFSAFHVSGLFDEEVGMAQLPSITECSGNSVVDFALIGDDDHIVNVIIPNAGLSTLELNGQPYTNFSVARSAEGTGRSIVTFDLLDLNASGNKITSDELFHVGVITGNSLGGSYGYLTKYGTELSLFNPDDGVPLNVPSFKIYVAADISSTEGFRQKIGIITCASDAGIVSINGHTGEFVTANNGKVSFENNEVFYISDPSFIGYENLEIVIEDSEGLTAAVCLQIGVFQDEICDNGIDDDLDGEIDELDDCMNTDVDLELAKNISNLTPTTEDEVTFTISVTNDSDVMATGVGVEDRLPAGYTLTGNISDGGSSSVDGDVTVITWNGVTILPMTTERLTFTANVNEGELDYKNIAQIISADQDDLDSTPNNDDGDQSEDDEDSVTPTVTVRTVDIEVAKVANVSSARVGDEINYSITVSNRSMTEATGISLEDVFPIEFNSSFVSNISEGGQIIGGKLIWSDLVIGLLSTRVLTYTVTIPNDVASGTFRNKVQVTSSDKPDSDSTPNNDDGDQSEDDEDSFEVLINDSFIDLSLTKNVNNPIPAVGDLVKFEVIVRNSGNIPATDVSISDVLPLTGFDLASITNIQPLAQVTDNILVWTLSEIAVNEEVMLSFDVIVKDDGVEYKNVAQVSSANENDVDSTPNNDDGDQSEDDEDSVTITPMADPDLIDISVDKSVSSVAPTIGDEIMYQVTIRNDGVVDATNIMIEDVTPGGIEPLEITGPHTLREGIITWTIPVIPVGESMMFEYSTFVYESLTDDYTNVVQVVAADQEDIDSTPNNDDGDQSEDDEASATIFPVKLEDIDLQLSKTVDKPCAGPSDNIVFTITLFNNSEVIATGVSVEDVFSDGFENIHDISNGGSVEGSKISWANLSLLPLETLSLTYSAEISKSGTSHDNVAQVTAADQDDEDSTPNNDDGDQSEDDEDKVVINGNGEYDLELEKTVDNPYARPGNRVKFEITVHNVGCKKATGVAIRDIIPSGYRAIRNITNFGLRGGNVIEWQNLTIEAGDSKTVSFTAEVVHFSINCDYINVAEILAADQEDIDSAPGNDDGDQSEDDEDTAEVFAGSMADMELTLSADKTDVVAGDTITFNMNVCNNGPANAFGVEIRNYLPEGLKLVGDLTYKGVQNGQEITWSGFTFVVNTCLDISFQAEVLDEALTNTKINLAEILLSNQLDPDSSPANGHSDATEDDSDVVEVTHYVALPSGLTGLSANTEVTLSTALYLEGAYNPLKGELNTTLNKLGYLPGQNPGSFFADGTPAGHPYQGAPWNYEGQEGMIYDYTKEDGIPYPEDVVDWVLIEIRKDKTPESQVLRRAAFLTKDGTVSMPLDADPILLNPDETYYILISHRNHLPIMSPSPLPIENGLLSFDFRLYESYTGLLGSGQKGVNGLYCVFAANGDQQKEVLSGFDINIRDKDVWFKNNGLNSAYMNADFDMNGDVNVNDQIIWLLNNGVFSDVPR